MDFSILKRETIYQGKAFNLQKVQAQLPNGRQPVYDLVQHPGAVAMVPLNKDGNILFVRQFRVGVGGALLEIPAGTLEPGEDPAFCAERELREEIGMAATSMREIGKFFLAPGYSSELLHVFLASELYASSLEGDEDEFMDVVSISIEQVYSMAQRGEFNDGKTLAALLLAQPYIQHA